MKEKDFIISFKSMASVLMAVLDISGSYTGFYDQFSKVRINFCSKREINNLCSSIVTFLKDLNIDIELSVRESEVTGAFEVHFPREAVDSELEMKFRIPENILISLLKKLFVDLFNLAKEESITITAADINSVYIDISIDEEEQITFFTEDLTQLAMCLQTFTILRSEDNKFKFMVTF